MGKYLWSIMTTKEGSEEEARKAMETTNRNCPYLVATGHNSNVVYSVYMVPSRMLCPDMVSKKNGFTPQRGRVRGRLSSTYRT